MNAGSTPPPSGPAAAPAPNTNRRSSSPRAPTPSRSAPPTRPPTPTRTPALREFNVDTAIPNTAIDSGPTGPTVSSTPTFAFSSNDPGSSSAAASDAAAYAPCSGPGDTHTPAAALAEGSHTFWVRALDAAGNIDATPASRAFSVDTQAPETTITSGVSGPAKTATPTFTFTLSQPGSTFECRIDSAAFGPCSGPGARHKSPVVLAEGPHTFEVRATDPATNTYLTPALREFNVDTAIPNTAIDSGPTGPTANTTPTFAFSRNEPGVIFRAAASTPLPTRPAAAPETPTPPPPPSPRVPPSGLRLRRGGQHRRDPGLAGLQRSASPRMAFVAAWGWGVRDGGNEHQICTSSCQEGIGGSGDGQLKLPSGVATDSVSNVDNVADLENDRIQKFDSSGDLP